MYDTNDEGIRTHGSSTDVEIRSNTIYTTGNDGIDARGTNVVVTSNTICDADKDGIHAEGASTVHVQHNTIHDVDDDGIESDGVNHSFINANQIYGAVGAGIQLDDAGTFTVTNNIVADSGTASVLVKTGASPHNFLYHNTLVGSAAGQQGTGISVTVPGITVILANNIVVSHTVGITKTAGATLVVSNTLLWANGSDPISGTSVITQAPLFAPPSQNYHVLPNSPAIDAGTEVGVLADVDGDPRLGAPDVGADEVVRKVYLPLVMRDYPSSNRLQNPGFEGITCRPGSVPPECLDNWTHDTHDGVFHPDIFTPQGWVTWWRTGGNYGQPESRVIPNVPPFTAPLARIRSGHYAAELFTFYRLQDTGLYQVITGLEPGATVQFSTYAHGWSCDSDHHPIGYSCGDLSNQTFQVGIEPNGVADPFLPSIIWSVEKTSPDYYSLIGPITAQVGENGSVCVYLRSKTKWMYMFQDAYWDDTSLVIAPPPP